MHALTGFNTQEQRDTHLGRPLRDRHQPLWQQDRVPHLHGAWLCLPGHDLPAHPTGAGGGGQGLRRVWRRCCRHQLNRSATPAGGHCHKLLHNWDVDSLVSQEETVKKGTSRDGQIRVQCCSLTDAS